MYKTEEGKTPISIAMDNEAYEFVSIMIQQCPEEAKHIVSDRNRTPLQRAVELQQESLVKLLLGTKAVSAPVGLKQTIEIFYIFLLAWDIICRTKIFATQLYQLFLQQKD